MNDKTVKAIKSFITYLKQEEEFDADHLELLKELVDTIMDVFIQWREDI